MTGEPQKILILGVGNILYTDEGVGVRAVERLLEAYDFSDNVTLMDGGNLGMRLAGGFVHARINLLAQVVHFIALRPTAQQIAQQCLLVDEDRFDEPSVQRSRHRAKIAEAAMRRSAGEIARSFVWDLDCSEGSRSR